MEGILEVPESKLESVHNQGLVLPYVEFDRIQPAIKLVYGGQEFWYYRTLPLRGYGAVLGRYARQLLDEGKSVLLARFLSGRNFSTSHHWERLYLYATGVKPIGAGNAPA
jgi:hypothetical protein